MASCGVCSPKASLSGGLLIINDFYFSFLGLAGYGGGVIVRYEISRNLSGAVLASVTTCAWKTEESCD